jgi:hypothetical protein
MANQEPIGATITRTDVILHKGGPIKRTFNHYDEDGNLVYSVDERPRKISPEELNKKKSKFDVYNEENKRGAGE